MVNNLFIINKLGRLERSLKRKLLAFYNSKLKDSIIPIGILKQKYDQQVREIIRKTAQESYLIGTAQVGNEVLTQDQTFQLFISGTDLNNIQGLTTRISNDFWNTSQRLQDREQAVTPEGKPKNPLNHVAAITQIAATLAFSAFNKAVKSKTTQVTSLPVAIPPPSLPSPIIGGEPEFGDITVSTNFNIERIGRVRFVTKQDGKVDKEICAPLHGMEWFVDDPTLVTPIDDTHLWCRCILEPVIETGAGTGPTETVDFEF